MLDEENPVGSEEDWVEPDDTDAELKSVAELVELGEFVTADDSGELSANAVET